MFRLRFSSRRRGSKNHRRSTHKRRGAGRRRHSHFLGEMKGRKVWMGKRKGWRIHPSMKKRSGRKHKRSGHMGRPRGSKAARRFSRRRGAGRRRSLMSKLKRMFKFSNRRSKFGSFGSGRALSTMDMAGPFSG